MRPDFQNTIFLLCHMVDNPHVTCMIFATDIYIYTVTDPEL